MRALKISWGGKALSESMTSRRWQLQNNLGGKGIWLRQNGHVKWYRGQTEAKERGCWGKKQKITSSSKQVSSSWKGRQEGFWSADTDTFLIWFYLYHRVHFIMSHKYSCDMHPFLYVKFWRYKKISISCLKKKDEVIAKVATERDISPHSLFKLIKLIWSHLSCRQGKEFEKNMKIIAKSDYCSIFPFYSNCTVFIWCIQLENIQC